MRQERLFLAPMLVALFGNAASAQDVYFVRNKPEATIVRLNANGSGPTVIVDKAAATTAIAQQFPTTIEALIQRDLDIDTGSGKLYFVAFRTAPELAGPYPCLLRANLDGSEIELLYAPTAQSSASESFFSPTHLPFEPGGVPAVSTWGLAALALTIAVGGSLILFSNRCRPQVG